VGYSGFEVTRQYENPATWTFGLASGAAGNLFYEYNVTEDLPFFLDHLNWTWTIMQGNWSGSYTLASISGSKVIQYQNDTANASQVTEPNSSYVLGVQLSAVNYTVGANGLVNVTLSLKALLPGTWVQAMDLE
jgi:hypothetical protein